MHKDLLSEIDLYFSGRLDLWDLIDEITYYSTINFDSVKQAIDYLEDKEDDESLIVEVLLWILVNSPIREKDNSSNSFYRFLNSLKKKDDSFYKVEPVWLFNDKHIAIFKKEELLFIINSNKHETCVELPVDYCHSTLLCINCNEEIDVDIMLNIPGKTFFILEKEN